MNLSLILSKQVVYVLANSQDIWRNNKALPVHLCLKRHIQQLKKINNSQYPPLNLSHLCNSVIKVSQLSLPSFQMYLSWHEKLFHPGVKKFYVRVLISIFKRQPNSNAMEKKLFWYRQVHQNHHLINQMAIFEAPNIITFSTSLKLSPNPLPSSSHTNDVRFVIFF